MDAQIDRTDDNKELKEDYSNTIDRGLTPNSIYSTSPLDPIISNPDGKESIVLQRSSQSPLNNMNKQYVSLRRRTDRSESLSPPSLVDRDLRKWFHRDISASPNRSNSPRRRVQTVSNLLRFSSPRLSDIQVSSLYLHGDSSSGIMQDSGNNTRNSSRFNSSRFSKFHSPRSSSEDDYSGNLLSFNLRNSLVSSANRRSVSLNRQQLNQSLPSLSSQSRFSGRDTSQGKASLSARKWKSPDSNTTLPSLNDSSKLPIISKRISFRPRPVKRNINKKDSKALGNENTKQLSGSEVISPWLNETAQSYSKS